MSACCWLRAGQGRTAWDCPQRAWYFSRVPLAELEEALIAAIKPFVGEVMASASVKSFSKKLGLAGSIAVADRARLIDAVGLGLNVFIGKAKTLEVLTGLRQKLLQERP